MRFPSAESSAGEWQAFSARMKQGTFLVVDDFDSMRRVTSSKLRQLGATHILEAANGAEALKIIKRQQITMVLSDWNMPVMSGLELLLNLRSDPDHFAIPFLMITGEAERDRVMQAIQAGVSGLLVKPYTDGRLTDRIEKTLAWKPRQNKPIDPVAVMANSGVIVTMKERRPIAPNVAEHPDAIEAATPNSQKRDVTQRPTILVVDDAADNLQLLSQLFKSEYRVKIAHNGQKALAICHSDTPPDLVMLDIMMPNMDGFEVARQLRDHPSSEHIPIIFVTAMTDETARFKGMELGAVDFVTKPIDPVAIKVRVQNFMRYIELHRHLQADYDNMMETARLKDDVEIITRHDIKGPLAGILGLLNGLSDAKNLAEDQREQLRLVEETTLQVLDMINLSSELYKIETGRFICHPEPVSISDIIRRIVPILRKTYAVKEITLKVDAPDGIRDDQLIANGDAMLCYSLFQNLLKNACEAAPDGSTVTITLNDSKPLRITIDNNGAVPAGIRERFFEKFTTAGKQSGTGLGTYSAKLLVEAQGGSIAMETSDEKNHTRLTVTLPVPA
jgi:two-component system sensor histidine kinase/response regulator